MTTPKNTSLANEPKPASASWGRRIRSLLVDSYLLLLASLVLSIVPISCVIVSHQEGVDLFEGVDPFERSRERRKLLHDTDYPALLAASRDMIRDYPDTHISNPEHDPRVPQIIRDLGPSYIVIYSDYLHVELHGGFEHYGFIAVAAGVPDWELGRPLIEGLYYYTD